MNPAARIALRQIRTVLEETEEKLRPSSQLWQREWAAMAVRGVLVEIAKLERAEPDVAGDTRPLRDRAIALRVRLDEMDAAQIGPYTERLRAGTYTPEDFKKHLAEMRPYEWDPFVQRLLGIDDVPVAELERATHMNKYQPTPLSVILELIDLLAPGDVLYDLGCGLGKVTLLAGWLSLAISKGVEFDPAYSRVAEQRAKELHLDRVRLITADVRDVDYSDGDFFYFFFPFDGAIMRAVLDRISPVAKQKKIRVGSLGKCTPAFIGEPWLELIEQRPSGLTVFRSR